MSNTWYLAGPMTGYPKFNYPAFIEAAESLRREGFEIISPAELDAVDGSYINAFASENGDLIESGITETWGGFLSRDVKIITDHVTGVVFLDGWEKSKGARLEAFVGLLVGHQFGRYLTGGRIEGMTAHMVLTKIARQTLEDIRDV